MIKQNSPISSRIRVVSDSGDRTLVVLYLRMSTDEQTDSIAQQRKECRAYAERMGWTIVGEYIDAGKSGSKEIEKRVEFHRMLADAKRGEWNAILCYDTSRFGRLDSQYAAQYKVGLREAGVFLETVREGRLDWSTSIGRITDTLKSEQDHEYSTKLAAGTLRGRVSAMEAGWWPHGRIPYGYDREYWYDGKAQMVVPRREKSHKPKGAKLRLRINEPEAKVIRWIYDEYNSKDISLRSLSRELTKQGVATPRGVQGWSLQSLVEVLANPAYAGDCAIGHQRGGRKGKFEQAAPALNSSAPVIVPRDVWLAVQVKRQARKESCHRVHGGKAGALSGLLVCGNCGHHLVKKERDGLVYYVCASKSLRPHFGCRVWRVYQAKLLPEITRLLVEAVDEGLLKRISAGPQEAKPDGIEALRSQIEAARKQIVRGTENLLKSDPEIFFSLQEKLNEWKADLRKLENTLALLEAPQGGEKDGHGAWVRWRKAARLITLAAGGIGEPLRDEDVPRWVHPKVQARLVGSIIHPPTRAEVDALRDLLHRLRLSVTLWWTPNGSRQYSLEKGLLKAEFGEHVLSGDSLNRNKITTVQRIPAFLIERHVDFRGKFSGSMFRAPLVLTRAQRQAAYRQRRREARQPA